MARKSKDKIDQLVGIASMATQMYFDAHPEEGEKYHELRDMVHKLNKENNAGPLIDRLKQIAAANDQTKTNL